MGSLIYILFICVDIPLLVSMPLFEKKARINVLFFVVGSFMCMFVSTVNGFIRNFFGGDLFMVTTTYTPITEEILKAIPVLLYAFLFTSNRKDLLSVSIATGIGFAILENAFIIINNISSVSIFWAVTRVFGASLMHAMCTGAIGLGCSFIGKRKKLFITGIFALATTSITYHGIFNALIQSEYSIFGYLLPVITFIAIVILEKFKFKKI